MKRKKAKVAPVEKRSVGRPKAKLPTFRTMAEASNATGIPVAVMRWAKLQQCEAFRYGGVETALLMPFLFLRLPANKLLILLDGGKQPELPLNGTLTGRPALDVFRAKREEIRLQKDMDQVMSKSDVKQDNNEAVAELFGTLERVLVNELPPLQEGMRALEIRNQHQAMLDSCKEQLRNRFSEMEKGGDIAKVAA